MHSVCYASAHVNSCSAEVYTHQQITDMHVLPHSLQSSHQHNVLNYCRLPEYRHNRLAADCPLRRSPEREANGSTWYPDTPKKVICWTGNKITVLMQNARNPACQQGDRYGPDRPCPLSPMVVSDQCPVYVTYVLICLSRYPVCVRSCQKQIGHRLDMPAHPFFIKHWLSSHYSRSPCFGQFSKPTKARPST